MGIDSEWVHHGSDLAVVQVGVVLGVLLFDKGADANTGRFGRKLGDVSSREADPSNEY